MKIQTYVIIFVTNIRLKLQLKPVMTQSMQLSLHALIVPACLSVGWRYDKALSWMSHHRADRRQSDRGSGMHLLHHFTPSLYPLNPTSRRPELLTAAAPTTGAYIHATKSEELVEGRGVLVSCVFLLGCIDAPSTHEEMLKDVLSCTQIHMCFTEACPRLTLVLKSCSRRAFHVAISPELRRKQNTGLLLLLPQRKEGRRMYF